jgi:hypothetical protein
MLLSCAFPVPNVLKQICASSGAAERFAIFRLCEKNAVRTESAFENNLPFLCGRLASISIALAGNGRILELLPFSALTVLFAFESLCFPRLFQIIRLVCNLFLSTFGRMYLSLPLTLLLTCQTEALSVYTESLNRHSILEASFLSR